MRFNTRLFQKILPFLTTAALLLAACSGEQSASVQDPYSNDPAPTTPVSAAAVESAAMDEPAAQQEHSGQEEDIPEPTVTFTLATTTGPNGFAFRGVGGDIDGKLNPQLHVNPGDVVKIVLINGDGIEHDFSSASLDAHTEHVTTNGSQAETIFEVTEQGTYEYFCTIPGHRQTGMEGLIVVGDAAVGEVELTEAPEVTYGDPASATAAAPSGASQEGVIAQTGEVSDIVLDPVEVPPPLQGSAEEMIVYDLETVELTGQLADGTTYTYWTFNSTVPGPFLRVRVGDMVQINLTNRPESTMAHSIDLHAVNGPGGGATVTQVAPGETKSFTFRALNPGLYVYHCATPMVSHHIMKGMYGLILVEPEEGLPEVDHEFYVMQGEIYTAGTFGQEGHQEDNISTMLSEDPQYLVFNGAVGALTEQHPLQANVGDTVRIYFGVGGPNLTSSFHVIGEIFDRVYDLASITSPPLTNVQTVLVPPGGAAMVEFTIDVPGRYILVDHALSRMEKGLVGFLVAEGEENPDVFHSDEEPSGEGH